MAVINFNKNTIFLAPMAGFCDSAFRQVCKMMGADYTVSEMISAKAVSFNDKKSVMLANSVKDEHPFSIQLFGSDPSCMAYAAQYMTNTFSPEIIDINMGCPAPKIFNNGEGSALMQDLDKAFNVIKSTVDATDRPVSVKFRAGVSKDSINAVEFGMMCQSAGASFICVHGRTRDQYYSGLSDTQIIKEVKEAVSIPVIANGDIRDESTAFKILNETKADAIMVGRAALGNPYIFKKLKYFFETGKKLENLSLNKHFEIALLHLRLMIKDKGEKLAVLQFRKHFLHYLKGIKFSAAFKSECCNVKTYDDCVKIIDSLIAVNV